MFLFLTDLTDITVTGGRAREEKAKENELKKKIYINYIQRQVKEKNKEMTRQADEKISFLFPYVSIASFSDAELFLFVKSVFSKSFFIK